MLPTAAAPTSTLPTTIRSDSRGRQPGDSGRDISAIVCGMPLPSAPANQRRVIQTQPAPASGVTTSGSHHHAFAPSRKKWTA